MAVRDALKAAGIAEDRLVLLKPEFVIAGTAEAEARRREKGGSVTRPFLFVASEAVERTASARLVRGPGSA